MKIEITKNVTSHHTNPDYPTLRVCWEPSDTNFHIGKEGVDWCPRDREVLEIVYNLSLVSDSFYSSLVKFVKVMEQIRG